MDFKKLRENQTVEIKEAGDKLPNSLFETYSSFANSSGGTIYLGIKEKTPNNIIVGVTNAPMLKKTFFDAIHNKSKVSVALVSDSMWNEFEVEGKTVVSITIPEAPLSVKPVYLNGNPTFSYLRGHEGDYIASTMERRAMELDAVPQKFDMRPNTMGFTLSDLRKESLDAYRSVFDARNPGNLFMGEDMEDFLYHIGALKRDADGILRPTNAAILLFGDYLKIKEIFPEYNLDYIENLSGTSRWDYRLDASSLTWSGNAFDFFRIVSSHIQPLLPNKFHLDGVYEDGGELLLECVREGLTNAIANCDYLLPGGIKITYGSGVIEFKNAGRLRLSLPQVLQGGDSDPRNEGVMNLLHLAKIGDKAGEGIPNIYRRMASLGYPEPILVQSSAPSSTKLTLYFTSVSFPSGEAIESKIIHILSERGEAGVAEIARILSSNNTTISLALKNMQEAGLVIDNGKKTKGKTFRLRK